MTALAAQDLRFGYTTGFDVAVDTLAIETGAMVALLGPNGSGKTTLLKLLSGVLRPGQGSVRLLGETLHGRPRKAIAQNLAVVPQNAAIPFAFTVREIAMLGRTAYARLLRDETAADRQAVSHALRMTHLSQLADHRFDQLSGGEQQRVLLAMALAQEPRVLLMDEPTTHLDIAFQVQTLDLVRRLNAEQAITVVAAMHDLNLAALYFPRLLLMRGGRIVADGSPDAVLTIEAIRAVYGAETVVERHPIHGVPQVLAAPGRARVKGLWSALAFLTRLPIPVRDARLEPAVPWLPTAGLILGGILALVDLGLRALPVSSLVSSVVLVVLLLLLTGALHADGLMDTCDAVFSHATPERRLEIMRDPRSGAFGVVGIVCVVLLKVAGIDALPPGVRSGTLVLAPTLGRWAIVLLATAFRYGRPTGLGAPLKAAATPRNFVLASLLPVVLCFVLWPSGPILGILTGVGALLLGRWLVSLLPGLTGDSYGAGCELVETLVLLTAGPLARLLV